VLYHHPCIAIVTALRKFLKGNFGGTIINSILEEFKEVQVVAGELLLEDGQKTSH
jgi:hypothetical protein